MGYRDALRRGSRHSRTEVQIGADPEKLGIAHLCNDGLTIAKEFDLKGSGVETPVG